MKQPFSGGAITAVLLLLSTPRDAAAHNVGGGKPGQDALRKNRKTSLPPATQGGPVYNFSSGAKEEAEGGSVNLPLVDDFQQDYRQARNNDFAGSAQVLNKKPRSRQFDAAGRRHKRRASQNKRPTRGTPRSGSLLKQAEARQHLDGKLLAALATSIAAIQVFLTRPHKLWGGGKFRDPFQHFGLLSFPVGVGEETEMLENENTEKDVDDGASALSSSADTTKTIGDRRLLSSQDVFIIVFLSILLVTTASSGFPVPERRGSSEDQEPRQRTPEEGNDSGAPQEELLVDTLSRGALVRLRRLSRLPLGDFGPRVDYQQRLDGSFHVVVGRAWKQSPDGPWMDGNSHIQFNYLGHSFSVYIPRDAERLLTGAGGLNEVLEALSQPPSGVTFLPIDKVETDVIGEYRGVLHWGPLTYDKREILTWRSQGVKYMFHLPPSFYSILYRHGKEANPLLRVFDAVAQVFISMQEQGLNFRPPVLQTKNTRVEL